MRFLHENEGDDPILSVVNLIDVFLVLIALLMIIIVRNPLNPFNAQDVTVVENPGAKDMRITVKKGQEITKYESTGTIGEGQGVRAGVAYKLPDGKLIYVPETCLYRELHPGVLVVQAAENGHSEDSAERLYRTVDRAILV